MDQKTVTKIVVTALERANVIIITGPLGCGKKYVVRKSLAEKYSADSKTLETGEHPDHTIINGQELKVDEVRALKGSVYQRAAFLEYRYTTITHVDRLNNSVAAALLKILEEAPPKSRWFMTATRGESVISTIKSRGFQMTLSVLPEKEVADILEGEGLSKPITRARWAEGNINYAREIDPVEADMWSEWWSRLFTGGLKAEELMGVLKKMEDSEYDVRLMKIVGVQRLAAVMRVDPQKWEKYHGMTMRLVRDMELERSSRLQRQTWVLQGFAEARQKERGYEKVRVV